MITLTVKKILWEVAKSRQQTRNKSNSNRDGRSHFKLPSATPLHCPIVLPIAPSLLPSATFVPSPAPSMLLLKRLCSLSKPKRQFEIAGSGCIQYIYILFLLGRIVFQPLYVIQLVPFCCLLTDIVISCLLIDIVNLRVYIPKN